MDLAELQDGSHRQASPRYRRLLTSTEDPLSQDNFPTMAECLNFSFWVANPHRFPLWTLAAQICSSRSTFASRACSKGIDLSSSRRLLPWKPEMLSRCPTLSFVYNAVWICRINIYCTLFYQAHPWRHPKLLKETGSIIVQSGASSNILLWGREI